MLYLKNTLIWDFWLLRVKDTFHLFYLECPRKLAKEKNDITTIGHAVSTDLYNWETKGTILSGGAKGDWDDLCLWTGCTVELNGKYYLFYTGRKKSEAGRIQRIGVAVSDDLHHFVKMPQNPILVADKRWYEETVNFSSVYPHVAWRDPYVVKDPDSDYYYAFITARTNTGSDQTRGCIGLARSTNLLEWECLPPVYAPNRYRYLEVPAVYQFGNRWYLLYGTKDYCHAVDSPERRPETGCFYTSSEELLGPYLQEDHVLVGTDTGAYTTKLVQTDQGLFALFHITKYPGLEPYAGFISDPFPVNILNDGRLSVDFEIPQLHI